MPICTSKGILVAVIAPAGRGGIPFNCESNVRNRGQNLSLKQSELVKSSGGPSK